MRLLGVEREGISCYRTNRRLTHLRDRVTGGEKRKGQARTFGCRNYFDSRGGKARVRGRKGGVRWRWNSEAGEMKRIQSRGILTSGGK